ncbi:MAG: DNA cytosine methyltransferase [Dehalococcoidia bacterium]
MASPTRRRATLFFRIADILDARRSRAFLLENVKNLRSHDRGRTYAEIRSILISSGTT